MTHLFDQSEFQQRLENVRAKMAHARFDVLIVTDPCNIYYLTGYDAWSFYTPQALLVFLDRDPVIIVRQMDVAGVQLTSCLTADQTIGFDEGLVQSSHGHPFEVVADTIRRAGAAAASIAVEKDSYYLSVRAYECLAAQLEQASFTDSQLLVNWVRFVKSPAEVEIMRQAGQLLTHSMLQTIDAIAPDALERDVVSRAYASNIQGVDFGGTYTSSPAFVLSGDRIKTPHLPWVDQKMTTNTQVNLELMGNRHRYQCNMGRTVHIGQPPAKLAELAEIICEAIGVVLDMVRPGVTCHTVAETLYAFLRERGIHKDSRCGYSLGIAYPPTGGELTASLRSGDETVLEPGVTMHFLPAIWADEVSVIISEPILVTESGYELLCDVPRKLFIAD